MFEPLMKFFGFQPSAPSADLVSDGESHWFRPNPSYSSLSGEEISQTSLLSSSAAFACTKALSETIAGLPDVISTWDKKSQTSTKDYSSRAYEMLALQPNDEMSSFTFWELGVSRIVNWGNFFAEIQRDGGDRPTALWPIHPSRVTPIRMRDGSLVFEIAHDYEGSAEYSDPTWRKNNLSYILSRNMLNIVGANSQNGIIAPGLLPFVGEEIGIELAARRYGANFFDTGAMPSGIVEHPKFIEQPDKRERFRQDINQIHKRNQIGVLWQGATWKNISMPPDQAQFLETRKLSGQQVCQFYGVSPSIIGDMEHSKYSTADQAIRQFVMITLRNLACRIEHAINRQVLNTSSNGKLRRAFQTDMIYNLALEGLLRGDPKMQAETNSLLRTSGAITTNEIRREHGMNPVPAGEGGDMLIVNGGMAELKRINEQGTRPESPQQKAASEPAADHSKLIELLVERAVSTAVSVPGFTPEQPDASGELIEACVDLAQDAVDRIHKITLSQVERWRTQDPVEVATKLDEFWEKQETRLVSALAPCDRLASRVVENTVVSASLSGAFFDGFRSLNNHSVFDADSLSSLAKFSIQKFVKAQLCCS